MKAETYTDRSDVRIVVRNDGTTGDNDVDANDWSNSSANACKLDIDYKLSWYLPYLTGTNKENIIIREMMALFGGCPGHTLILTKIVNLGRKTD